MTTTKKKMSAAHKRALAEGRTMSATVDRYVQAVNVPKPRGRKVSRATLEQRLVVARQTVKDAVGIDRVLAAQAARDYERKLAELAEQSNGRELKQLEAAFVKVARRFGERRGITWPAWRDAGVPAKVLARARIPRTR